MVLVEVGRDALGCMKTMGAGDGGFGYMGGRIGRSGTVV